ncbi:tRNA lysidine(34) synthetase TilS [Psychroserpens burtonensis]|uniref:tRNA(Ile)-lysidine synthase n=1 Tax=Psychroserpens burtonensis TaxID=49278 RepID=A0A5C7B419_9FLAO|nr:tRNA lysidine(34) synthetase TilS [Psychroserpens burtonensis]TXE15462.1 tRNA lysidine(34) synthetase TilS [Psychroserpens burtonensis]
MFNTFDYHITSNLSFLKESKLLIAISGGLDSVILTHLCHELKLDISLAHCNFNLRGKESDDDEDFVLELAETLDLEVFIERFSTEEFAKDQKLSTQMAARDLRYNWFSKLAESLHFDYILTAHHADDNLETFLINLTRGTGLSGLTGIPEINDNIVRPLLSFSRQELEFYATKHNIKWREDSSNASDKYLRNKLRHHVIPVLKETNVNLLQNFKTTLDHLNDTSDIVEESLRAVAKRAIIDIDEHKMVLDVLPFKKANNPKAYLYEMFKDYGFTAWDDMVGLLEAQSGKQILSDRYRLVKDRAHLILTHRNTQEDEAHTECSRSALKDTFIIHTLEDKTQTPAGTLSFDEVDAVVGNQSRVVFVDKSKLKFPLSLRQWQEGDVFYPLGMKGKKKLSKYFKDEKLSLVDKEHVWLLISEEKMVWVIDRRADERFKVTESTTHILKITLSVSSSKVEYM